MRWSLQIWGIQRPGRLFKPVVLFTQFLKYFGSVSQLTHYSYERVRTLCNSAAAGGARHTIAASLLPTGQFELQGLLSWTWHLGRVRDVVAGLPPFLPWATLEADHGRTRTTPKSCGSRDALAQSRPSANSFKSFHLLHLIFPASGITLRERYAQKQNLYVRMDN